MGYPVKRHIGALNKSVGRRYGRAIGPYPGIGTLDRELLRLLQAFDVDVLLDVGAHVGQFAHHIRRLGFAGQIISFEPDQSTFRTLSDAAGLMSRWDIHNIALGDVDGSSQLHTYAGDGQFNSIRTLSPHATVFEPELIEQGTNEVKMQRLDSMWPSLGANAATTLLKVDTQGFDLPVIEGAGPLLAEIPAILTEVAVKPLYEGAPHLEEVVADLRRHGFEMTGAFPIHRYGPTGTRVIEFDCTFVNVKRSMSNT